MNRQESGIKHRDRGTNKEMYVWIDSWPNIGNGWAKMHYKGQSGSDKSMQIQLSISFPTSVTKWLIYLFQIWSFAFGTTSKIALLNMPL